MGSAFSVHEERIVDQYLRALDDPSLLGAALRLGDLEERFVRVGSSFSDRRRISVDAWRDVGVPEEVLRRARIAPVLIEPEPEPV